MGSAPLTPPRAERAELVIIGDVVLTATARGLETAQAIGIAAGRVVSAGDRRAVLDAAAERARVIDASGSAVIPGLHDAHLHLVDLARGRVELDLGDAADFADVVGRVVGRASGLPPAAWLVGRGWSADTLDPAHLDRLEAAVGERPAFLRSRDGHSAWASRRTMAMAGISRAIQPPPGGVIERRADGHPNGILRETAVELVRPHVERVRGDRLAEPLGHTLAGLHGMGITGATDAGDFTAESGAGPYADLGDSFSALAEAAGIIGGRLRLNANLPLAALASAESRALRTGDALPDAPAIRVGWVKLFADGALGSRTAALFEPYTCGDAPAWTGVMTLTEDELTTAVQRARSAGIGAAVHAIGDRTNAVIARVYESVERGGHDARRDRIEHAQLTRPADRARIARLGVVASMQPIHCLSDRRAVERCWAGREADAYAWRSLGDSGALLAFGSDAPVESVDPWLGMQAAVHRRMADEPEAWQPQERLSFAAALAAYTLGPATAMGLTDEGHLRPGARADVAVLNRSLRELQDGDDLTSTRADRTLLGGNEP